MRSNLLPFAREIQPRYDSHLIPSIFLGRKDSGDRLTKLTFKKKKSKSKEVENAEWAEKFGEEAAKVIRETVDANVADYEYLKQFAMKVPFKEPEQL